MSILDRFYSRAARLHEKFYQYYLLHAVLVMKCDFNYQPCVPLSRAGEAGLLQRRRITNSDPSGVQRQSRKTPSTRSQQISLVFPGLSTDPNIGGGRHIRSWVRVIDCGSVMRGPNRTQRPQYPISTVPIVSTHNAPLNGLSIQYSSGTSVT